MLAAMSLNRSDGKTESPQELYSSYVAFFVPQWRCDLAGSTHALDASAIDDQGGKREPAEETSLVIIQIVILFKATESSWTVFSIALDASV
ncbi:MAG: hypothetical protein JSU93_00030 [Methanobacteriota archaeon]|nr:MAG: hypothetical protein JSU93_00030 [Euryarchaeota archaeon]